MYYLQSLGVLLEKLDFTAMVDIEIKDICESKFMCRNTV